MTLPDTSSDNEMKDWELDNERSSRDVLESGPLDPTDQQLPPDPAKPVASEIDGGARAWLQVLGSFLIFGNLWGLSFAFGNFESYYETHLLPDESASDIAWIGTFAIFLLIFGGIVSGPLFDLGYFRTMLLGGALTMTVGTFLLSLCKTYWQLFLAQAVLLGLGGAVLYIPGLALVGRSFKKNRSMAMSITTCGAPVGGVVYTLLFEQLISRLGFGDTVRAMGYYMLGTYCISFPLMLWGARNLASLAGTKRKLFDGKALTDPAFRLFALAMFFSFLGYLVPFLYLPEYGEEQLGTSQSFSYLINIIGQASSVGGRLAFGYAANRFGVMPCWAVGAFTSGIFCLGWIGVTNKAGYIAIAVLYGFSSGSLIPLPPSVFSYVCTDPKLLGTWLGMAQAFAALGSLVGGPIGGALIMTNPTGNRFFGMQLYSGLVLIIGGIFVIVLWVYLVKKRGNRIMI